MNWKHLANQNCGINWEDYYYMLKVRAVVKNYTRKLSSYAFPFAVPLPKKKLANSFQKKTTGGDTFLGPK